MNGVTKTDLIVSSLSNLTKRLNMHLVISFSCLVVQCVSSQFVSFQQQTPPNTNVCASPSNTALVEHFFNLIFSEFHNHPPVCVCVQMCPDHPTYCYPNGCFKKAEPRKKPSDSTATVKYQPTAQVSQLQQDNTQPMSFLVDGQSSYMDNLLNFKSADPKQVSKYDEANIGGSYKEMHRDPFKDRYQSIFKYKKTPKVHLRYNLREQVKHKKSDIIKIEKIDVSKTRWPTIVDNNKQYYLDKNMEHKDSKYFHVLENGDPHYPSKFFKRDVTKLFNTRDNNFEDVESTTEIATFSLENLIENLIESSFGPLGNDTELDLNVNLDYATVNNETTVEPITMPSKRSVMDSNNLLSKNTLIILNETTNVVSLNNTNQNLDVNRYRDDNDSDQIYKNVFNDMIASLSKHIDKNNNSSIEMMEQVLGHRIEDEDLSSNTDNIIETTSGSIQVEQLQVNTTSSMETIPENTVLESTTEVYVETMATATDAVSTEKEMEREPINVMRKTHKRMLRKSQNNKPN